MNGVLVIKIAIIAIAILAAAGAKYILHFPDKNPVQKIAVEIIEEETKDSDDEFVDVDLNQ